ncbi:MAG: DUF1501 domain-containing protein, partial [Planctomycetales bacterium]
MQTNRRRFLQGALGASSLISLSPLAPDFLLNARAAAADGRSEKVLVVLQLSGGNDGLNTVIPHADDAYRKNRYTLAVGGSQVLGINDYLGFHPSMKGMAELFENNQLAVVQGVGYPNPDRSHFESMDVWNSAKRKQDARPVGWLGRYLDSHAANDGRDLPAMHLGEEKQPLALTAHKIRVPSIHSTESFRLDVGDNEPLRTAAEQGAAVARPAGNDLLDFMRQSTAAALSSSRRVQEALTNYSSPVEYPGFRLASRLRTVAQLIDAGLGTKIYYLELGGFDTHSDQADAHAALLSQVSGSLAAFLKDVAHHGHGDRVLVMTFSEFGRRVKQNASNGTDHGAAAPMFLAGGKVKGGIIGEHPSLTDLTDGDLKFHTDFRRVYASVLEQWLGCPSEPILGEKYDP